MTDFTYFQYFVLKRQLFFYVIVINLASKLVDAVALLQTFKRKRVAFRLNLYYIKKKHFDFALNVGDKTVLNYVSFESKFEQFIFLYASFNKK